MNIVWFIISCVVVWKSSELVIQGIHSFSKKLKISSFAVSFLLLGILTSLTEMSVGFNAVLTNQPDIFVGNLIGGSFVILLLIIPMLAIYNKGVVFKNHLESRRLLYFLVLIMSPSFLILDGIVTVYDAGLILLLYISFFYFFQNEEGILHAVTDEIVNPKKVLLDLTKIIIGAILIFISSRVLVDMTMSFAETLGISFFLMSILILAIGTNLPEIVIAVNSIRQKNSDIAFGDYVGSAAANSMLFGVFTLMQGNFTLGAKGFSFTFLILFVGYGLFFLFARSKNYISAVEGIVLLLVYIVFILFQTTEIFIFSPGL